jgi:hypothetical protein
MELDSVEDSEEEMFYDSKTGTEMMMMMMIRQGRCIFRVSF